MKYEHTDAKLIELIKKEAKKPDDYDKYRRMVRYILILLIHVGEDYEPHPKFEALLKDQPKLLSTFQEQLMYLDMEEPEDYFDLVEYVIDNYSQELRNAQAKYKFKHDIIEVLRKKGDMPIKSLFEARAKLVAGLYSQSKLPRAAVEGKKNIISTTKTQVTGWITSLLFGADTKAVYNLLDKYFGPFIDQIISYKICLKNLPSQVCDTMRNTILMLYALYYFRFRDICMDILSTQQTLVENAIQSQEDNIKNIQRSMKNFAHHNKQIMGDVEKQLGALKIMAGADVTGDVINEVKDQVAEQATTFAFYDLLEQVPKNILSPKEYIVLLSSKYVSTMTSLFTETSSYKYVAKLLKHSPWASSAKLMIMNLKVKAVSIIAIWSKKFASIPILKILIPAFILGSLWYMGLDKSLEMVVASKDFIAEYGPKAYEFIKETTFDDWFKYVMVYPSYMYLSMTYKLPMFLADKIKTVTEQTVNAKGLTNVTGLGTLINTVSANMPLQEQIGANQMKQVVQDAYKRMKASTSAGGITGELISGLLQSIGITAAFDWGSCITSLLLFMFLVYQVTVLIASTKDLSKPRKAAILGMVAVSGYYLIPSVQGITAIQTRTDLPSSSQFQYPSYLNNTSYGDNYKTFKTDMNTQVWPQVGTFFTELSPWKATGEVKVEEAIKEVDTEDEEEEAESTPIGPEPSQCTRYKIQKNGTKLCLN